MKVVFFGASFNVFPIIEMLKNNFGLSLVVTTETDLPADASLQAMQTGEKTSIIPFCKSKGIEVVQVKNKEELKSTVLKLKPDLGVVADFGVIIPVEVLNIFPYGILNVHPSLVPKYRGATPVQTTILNGDTKTGVSIIKLDEKMDHGPVLIQEERQISPDDTAQSLYEILFREGARLLLQVIEPYLKGELKAVEQNHNEATFTKVLNRNNGFIDVSTLPAFEKLDKMTKAYYPWPGVWTRLRLSSDEQEKIVKFLPFRRIQVEGKNEMIYKDFINGYPDADSKLLEFLKKNLE